MNFWERKWYEQTYGFYSILKRTGGGTETETKRTEHLQYVKPYHSSQENFLKKAMNIKIQENLAKQWNRTKRMSQLNKWNTITFHNYYYSLLTNFYMHPIQGVTPS